jgi:hypothetical protein
LIVSDETKYNEKPDVEGHVNEFVEVVEEPDVEGHRMSQDTELVEEPDVEGHVMEMVEGPEVVE